MSDFHVQRLRSVETQLKTARAALTFAVRRWQQHETEPEFAGSGLDRLIFLVCQAENIALDPVLRSRLDDLRGYRNRVAHGGPRNEPVVAFRNALNALNTFVAKLPPPQN